MKKALLAILFAFSTLALSAQGGIKVNYQGDRPTISDFAWAYLSVKPAEDEEEEWEMDESTNAVKQAWIRHREGKALDAGETLSIDQKNGFVLYEMKDGANLLRIEMCYWNESDGKHKLFAFGVYCFQNGRYSPGQYDGLTFFRYDNATKTMTRCDDTGFEVAYSENGAWVSYDLPRTGKNITVNHWYDDGRKTQKTLKFDGRRFSF